MTESLILVGNGTSLLDACRGEEIDAFGAVGRFNAYVTRGYEPHTGRRTDLWFNVMGAASTGERLTRKYRQIYLHSWQKDPAKDKLLRDFAAALPPGSFQKIDHAIIDEMVNFTGDAGYRCWSTGALAIWLMLKQFAHVTLTGFDWWEREQHHYADKAARGRLHQPQIEKRFIDQLVAQGKVQFLR